MNYTSEINNSYPSQRKIISISSKRQITIPQKAFDLLGFGNEAECFVKGNELIIRPMKTQPDSYFSEQILEELIAEGLSGEELLKKFKEKQRKVRPAVENMLQIAKNAASDNGEYFSYDDVFSAED